MLWRDPTDICTRDLFYGPGGRQHKPYPPFQFEKENLGGTNPKFVVRDRDGEKWTVKLGVEARPETVATRLVWAVGYLADEDYFVPELTVDKMAPLKRGGELVGPGGAVRNARLERHEKAWKKTGAWRWRDGPFAGTRELNGLRVAMALIDNWDLKDENNTVYERMVAGGVERRYVVSDLGTSFGGTGAGLKRETSKGDLAAYSRAVFISKVTPEYVDFRVPSHPNLIALPNIPFYFTWLRMRWIGKRIPRADARWAGDLFGRLSGAQIRDAFRAAGYSGEELEGFAQVLERRIAALREL